MIPWETSCQARTGQKSPHSPVVVEDLEAIDVQNANHGVFPMKHWVVVFHLDHTVDTAYDPAEQPLIESLRT